MFYFLILKILFLLLFFKKHIIYCWLYVYFYSVLWLFISYWNIFYIGKKGFFFSNLINLFLLIVLMQYIYIITLSTDHCIFYNLYNIYNLENNINITISFYIDFFSLSFINLTILIGFSSYIYSYGYMRDEVFLERFLFLLLTFLYSMVLLLLSNNLTTILLGWELIGVSSYFLINFWVNKISTFKSAFKAFIFNRLSDVSLITFLILHISFYQNNYFFINYMVYDYNYFLLFNFNTYEFNNYDLLSIFVIICSFCKSAQFGFHIWLPDSMEAPVPASALIHSATLVSAGIYLCGRFWIVIFFSKTLKIIFFFICTWTVFYGAIIATYQTDLKKILAYSTISHCGFLMFLVTTNNLINIILYLYLHGFFKSLSFMCVGNIIKDSFNIQDFRYMGAKHKTHVYELFYLIFSLTNLSGYSLTFGFFSKHYLFYNISFYNGFFHYFFSIIIISALISFFYTYILIKNVFFSFSKDYSNKKLNKTTSWTSYTPPIQIISTNYLGLFSILYSFLLIFLLSNDSLFILNSFIYLNDYNINNCLNNKYLFRFYVNQIIPFYFVNIFLYFFHKNFYKNIFTLTYWFFFIFFVTL